MHETNEDELPIVPYMGPWTVLDADETVIGRYERHQEAFGVAKACAAELNKVVQINPHQCIVKISGIERAASCKQIYS